jgi:hypothetical protein
MMIGLFRMGRGGSNVRHTMMADRLHFMKSLYLPNDDECKAVLHAPTQTYIWWCGFRIVVAWWCDFKKVVAANGAVESI